jgi:hypothetical protein
MKRGRALSPIFILAMLAGLAGCASKPNDQQIGQAVQGKIYADSSITSRQIDATAANGVVTLNGAVANDAERQAAASDAAQVSGVKTVVNNLTVAASPAPTAPEPKPAAAATPLPARPAASAPRGHRRIARRARPSPPAPVAPASTAPGGQAPAADQSAAQAQPSQQVPVAPAAIVIPAGTEVAIRMIDSIDSKTNKPGDIFHASLDSPIVVGGQVVASKGADVLGQVAALKTSGKFTGTTSIALVLTRLSIGGQSYDIATDQYSAQSKARGTRTAETVGGGAVLGAIIGAIAGHGKGAAIGAAAGAGTGAAVQGLTKAQEVKIPSEKRLVFHLVQPVDVTPGQ